MYVSPVMDEVNVHWRIVQCDKVTQIMIGFTTAENQTSPAKKRTKENILEQYPHYDFDLADTQFSKISKTLVLYAVIPICWGGLLVLYLTGVIRRLKQLRSYCPRIVYIQKTNENWWKARQYMFMVDENRKWGLIDHQLKVLIPPQYDSMKWAKTNKLIEVLDGHDTYLVDTNNNKCV